MTAPGASDVEPMHTLRFALVTGGADLMDWATLDALYEAGCGDATVGHDTLEFARKAPTRDEALCSAMRDAESVPGVRVLRIELDGASGTSPVNRLSTSG